MDNKELNKVIGLKYEFGKGLPQVLLKGAGKTADSIIDYNKLSVNLPVLKNEKLVNELYKLPIDAEIGEDLFHLVASILVHVFAIEGKISEERT